MSLTNFGALTSEQKTVWSMDLWKQARNQSFINRFLGKGPNSMIQHITELKKSEKVIRRPLSMCRKMPATSNISSTANSGF